MNTIELRKQELENCRPEPTLDSATVNRFWDERLEHYEQKPLQMVSVPETTPYSGMEVRKVSFQGFDDTTVNAWYILPSGYQEEDGKLPCVVTFPGYSGDRGYPERYASWLLLGYAVLAVDVRGQGGETGNLLPHESGTIRGWITQGLLDKERSYYMAVAIDSVRAIEVAAGLPGVDPARIGVIGGSQGGGLALLTGALSRRVAAIVADIPNLCRLDFGVLNSSSSLTEIADHVRRYPERLEQILYTLAHFDIVNLAPRITAPVLMSAGWKDTVCMPETIYAAYNRIESPKQINDYPFSGHEVSEYQHRQAVQFFQQHLGNSAR
ncbi:cephalosporin-C deacetylase [Paenibacillus albidus]|uniref:Cephalosporin-C deacetylase n=1 Tax=Paenibacillus albidus TaxID=2041023 RepID=A0A917FFI5_9BACL|nr:alpha/beta fold hydrolase [Paenibacillus albidus]GGF70884.1 cephalosporin-C deacetylase [Paenibacillus albidus]